MLLASNRRRARRQQSPVSPKKKPSGGIPRAFLEVSHRCPSTKVKSSKIEYDET
jgi:hypothetical protein